MIYLKNIICKLLDISDVSYYRWKKTREVIPFLEKYFTKNELEEYLDTGKIEKLELIKSLSYEELKEKLSEESQSENINEVIIEHATYSLRDKMKIMTDGTALDWLYHYFSKKILIKVLENISNEDNLNNSIMGSKEILLDAIQKATVPKAIEGKREVLLIRIKERLSNLECYVLINRYEEVLNYDNFFQIGSKFKK